MINHLKIKRRDVKLVITFAILSSIITSAAAYASLFQFGAQPFFAMSVLGSKGLAADYFPGDNQTVRVGQPVNWTINVYNQMGTIEYVVVRVKLLNSLMAGPNDTTAAPSPVQPFIEFRRIMVNNETWSTRFLWQIENTSLQGDQLQISSLTLNNVRYSGSLATAKQGYNFRFVFELWFYEARAGHLVFSWHSRNAQYVVWNQIWFNAAPRSTGGPRR